MAFALFSVFEPPIVKHIYELAKKPNTVDVKVIYYPYYWDHEKSWTIPVPRGSEIYDLKVLISALGYFESRNWQADEMRLYVNQPWHMQYEEVGDEENVVEFSNDYDEFFLKLENGEKSE